MKRQQGKPPGGWQLVISSKGQQGYRQESFREGKGRKSPLVGRPISYGKGPKCGLTRKPAAY